MMMFRLESSAGFSLGFICLGASIVELLVPDRRGRPANVVLAHRDLVTYRTQTHCLGAVCGRYANRIDGGRFHLDGQETALAIMDLGSNVHGGPTGFDKVEWSLDKIGVEDGVSSARLSYISPHGDQGFSGTLKATVTYRLGPNWLEIIYRAVTDRPTVVSMTNHSYFNLAGEDSGSVEGHWMQVFTDLYTPSDARLVPTGAIESVDGTPFDFRRPKRIGRDIRSAHEMILAGRGFDVNFVLRDRMQPACRVWEPRSGRQMILSTSAPGFQFYSGNALDGSTVSRTGYTHRQSDGFCLEPHYYPNAPNVPAFPSPVLRPGETYESITRFDFSLASPRRSARQ